MERTGLLRRPGGRMVTILSVEGLLGIIHRITRGLKMGVQIRDAYIVSAYYREVKQASLPPIAIEVMELINPTKEEDEALARIGFHTNSRGDVTRYLSEGQRCFVAKHDGQVVSCFWVMRNEFFDYRIKRSIQLSDDEEYFLGGFTLPEFRGKGIIHYLFDETMRYRTIDNPNMRALAFIDVRNTAMLRTIAKAGFMRVGHIGYFGLLGIRFTYIFSGNMLPKTKKRFAITI
jgi:GNAT superfamily N-acetyltransferase